MRRLHSMLAAGALGLLGCGDGQGERLTTPGELGLQALSTLSAYPAVQESGAWRRACGAEATTGVIVGVGVVTSNGRVRAEGVLDRDLGVRPGDAFEGGPVGGTGNEAPRLDASTLRVHVDCLEGLPADPEVCARSTDLVPAASVAWAGLATSRATGHDVLVLVDMSASIRGLVDAVGQREGGLGGVGPDFTQMASDYTNRRMAAVEVFVDQLNPQDRVAVMGFGEGLGEAGLLPACDSPDLAGAGWETRLAACLPESARAERMSGLQALRMSPSGLRSNLWEAIDSGAAFLQDVSSPDRTRHVIVLTDGPDTCNPRSEHWTPCAEGACSDVGTPEVMQRLDQARAAELPIQVHFVQFESVGYPGPDAQQIEVACHSGGHHQFVPSLSLDTVEFQNALVTRLTSLRHALGGHWEAAVPVPALGASSSPAGALLSVGGRLDVLPESRLVAAAAGSIFGPGAGPEAAAWTVLRKPCLAASDCGADEPGACGLACSPETRLCAAPGRTRPDGSLCADGTDGVCCGGECAAECAACAP